MVIEDAEQRALRAMYDECARPLFGFALRLCDGDRGRAEDVVQETLVRAWQHRERLAANSGPMLPWLYTVARRIAIDEHRRRGVRPNEIGGEGAERALMSFADAADIEAGLDRIVVLDALSALSAEHRDVIMQTYYAGRTVVRSRCVARRAVRDGEVAHLLRAQGAAARAHRTGSPTVSGHDETRFALAGYALGTLEPAEQASIEAHLATCPSCLLELDELAGVVPALAALTPADVWPPEPSADLFGRIADAVGDGPAHESAPVALPSSRPDTTSRRRLTSRRWLLSAAASVVVLAGAATAGVAVVSSGSPSGSPSGSSSTTTASATAGTISLDVAATDAGSGTRLALDVHGLPGRQRCHLVATAANGTTHDAGTRNANYDGDASVIETTDVARSQLRTLTLFGTGGRTLVTVNLT